MRVLAGCRPGGYLLVSAGFEPRNGLIMSDEFDWDFAGADDAKVTIRAAVSYLLRGTPVSDRGGIVREIIEIVRQVASGAPPAQPHRFDDEPPGG
jgi:hypothetical protein